jgi:deoxyribodipyrimidine photolyase-like uncharacterized protein
LMVMCNFMNLCGIHPDQVYKWFMEFSTDSYEWLSKKCLNYLKIYLYYQKIYLNFLSKYNI